MGLVRLFLAICVFFSHAPAGVTVPLPGGWPAVESFFIISGFYIALVWSEKYGRLENGAKTFIINRWLRLAPAYIAVALAIYITRGSGPRGMEAFAFASKPNLFLTLLSYVTLIGQDLFNFMIYDLREKSFQFVHDGMNGVYSATPGERVQGGWFLMMAQGWSVGVEMWFYLTAPFFILSRNRYLVALFGLSLVVKIIIHAGLGWNFDPWIMRFFPSELMFFILGIFAYRFYKSYQNKWNFARWGWFATFFLIAIGIGFGGFFIPAFFSTQWPVFLNAYGYQFLVLISLPFIFASSRSSKWDRWIGNLSYPFYILHLYCMDLVYHSEAWPWKAFALTLALSVVVVYAIENPMDKIREKIVKRSRRGLVAKGLH